MEVTKHAAFMLLILAALSKSLSVVFAVNL